MLLQDIFIMRLVALMEEKDLTQIELANLIGTTNVTISRYISGERKPRIEIVEEIAKVFDVSLDYLLGSSNVRKLPNGKTSITYPKLQHKIDRLSELITRRKFTKDQLFLIEMLLETNINFISELNLKTKKRDF